MLGHYPGQAMLWAVLHLLSMSTFPLKICKYFESSWTACFITIRSPLIIILESSALVILPGSSTLQDALSFHYGGIMRLDTIQYIIFHGYCYPNRALLHDKFLHVTTCQTSVEPFGLTLD